ncbi:MAG: GAF domain-containing protein, partial [Halovenus sp.]
MSITVLVVGGCRQRRDSVATALSAAGFETETATKATGSEAVDCLVYGLPAERHSDAEQIVRQLSDPQQPAIRCPESSDVAASIPTTDIESVVSSDSEAVRADRTRELSGNRPLVADGGTALGETEFPLERLHEIATDRELSRSEKIDALLTAGKDRLETSDAFLTRIEGETQEVIRSVGEHPELTPGTKAPLSETYCQYTIDREEPLSVRDAESSEVIEQKPYDRFGLRCYLGTTIHVNGDAYGTVCFVDTEPGDSAFDTHEQTFLKVLTDWISYLLEQQVYEHELDQQRAFTESLMDSLPDPLYATDEKGRLRRWNSRFEETIGSGEIEGRQLTEFVAEAHSAAFDEAISTA